MRNVELYDIFFKCLDAGHRFGFTGSGESHYQNPGFNGALTGVRAELLDRSSILDALPARRCYATAGQWILIELTINDQMMGCTLLVHDDPLLRWRVVGHDQEYLSEPTGTGV